MNIYLISQTKQTDFPYIEAAVVCAPDEETARNMNPEDGSQMKDKDWHSLSPWCVSPNQVKVEYLGITDRPQGLVLANDHQG